MIDNLIISSMGNNQSSNWRAEFDLSHSSGNIRSAFHRQSRQRYEVLTLFPGSEGEAEGIVSRIKSRISRPSAHLLGLHSFWKNSQVSACGSGPSIDLLFRSGTALEEYLALRRIKNETFSRQEVEYVICRVAGGLSDIREMREECGCVDLGTVFVDGQVKLRDPFLMKEALAGKGRKLRGYPSPQKLYTFYDSLSSFQEHTSDLFSLGILALQLIYPHQNLSSIYRNTHSQYLNCTIDINQLKVYVNGVQDYLLRRYVTALTDEQPNRRTDIYQLLKERTVNGTNLRILMENPYETVKNLANNNPEKYINGVSHVKPVQKVASHIPNTVILPRRQSVKVEFSTLPREAQSFSFPIQNPIPYNALTSTAHSIFTNGNYKQEPDPWRKSHPFSSNIGFMESESTPINKINGANINSFRSPSYDLNLPRAPLLQELGTTTYRPQFSLTGKVSPKLIDATYHSPFIPTSNHTAGLHQGITNEKREQDLIVEIPQSNPQQKLNNQSPQQQPQSQFPERTISRQAESPQLQVKTSQQALQIIKNSLIATANNDSNDNMIKFESIRSKMVESVNQLQKQAKIPIQKDGYVVQQFDIGTRYEGFKKNGMRNGQGQFVYKQGSRYRGEWKDNKMQGFGTLYYPNGQIAYEGQWKDDQFHGMGTVFNDNPVAIKGGFDYTNFNSVDEEWVKYEGNLKRDAKDGQGKLYLTNGELFTGSFENDFVHGEGSFKRYNGSFIHGIWQEGLLKKIHPS